MTRASHVPHPTGAAVPKNPQRTRRPVTAECEWPSRISRTAIAAITAGIPIRRVYRRLPSSRLMPQVPATPARPTARNASESSATEKPVTVSRKGLR
jgi:hypothetical protein